MPDKNQYILQWATQDQEPKFHGKQRLRWDESIVRREEMPTNIDEGFQVVAAAAKM